MQATRKHALNATREQKRGMLPLRHLPLQINGQAGAGNKKNNQYRPNVMVVRQRPVYSEGCAAGEATTGRSNMRGINARREITENPGGPTTV